MATVVGGGGREVGLNALVAREGAGGAAAFVGDASAAAAAAGDGSMSSKFSSVKSLSAGGLIGDG